MLGIIASSMTCQSFSFIFRRHLCLQALAFRAWLYHAIIEFCNWLLSLVGLAEQHTKDIRGQAQLQMQHATGQARQHAEGIAAQARETADQAAQRAKEVAAQAKQQAMDATNTH